MPLKFLKRTGQLILIPIIVGMIVMAMLAGAYLLPTEGMKAHVRSTLDVFEKEGLYFNITGERGERHDNFNEAVYLSQALVGAGDADLLSCVLTGHDFVYRDSGDPVANITAAVTDPESVHVEDTWLRFFNGHVALIKPLLLVMGYTGIRLFCAYFCIAGTVWMGWLLHRRGLGRFIIPFLLAVLFLRPIAVWLSMTFTGFYACMLIPCIAMLLMKKETLRQKAWLVFGITGSFTFCFNMNYFQLICFGIPMLMYFLIAGIPEKPMRVFLQAVDLFIAWIIGYAGAMVFKWTLYAVFVDGSVFGKMFEHALWRSGVDQGSRMETILFNVRTAFGNIWWDLLEIGFILGTVILRIRRRERFVLSAAETVLLAIAALLPVIRIAALANHSMIHGDFVYRVFMIPVLAFNIFLAKE